MNNILKTIIKETMLIKYVKKPLPVSIIIGVHVQKIWKGVDAFNSYYSSVNNRASSQK
uniref:Uncharacterized protein n=1 Tax=Tetranychus urticae TaxID=32264 RepID=T1JT89_TETUR